MPRGVPRRPRCPAGQHRNAQGDCVPREEVFANIEARRRDRQQGQRGRARRDNTAQSPRAGGSATSVPTLPADAPRIPQFRTVQAPVPTDDDYVYGYQGALFRENYNVLTNRVELGTQTEYPVRIGRRTEGRRGRRMEALDADEPPPRLPNRTIRQGPQYLRDRRGREYRMVMGRRVYLDDELADIFS